MKPSSKAKLASTHATVSLWADNGSFTSTYRRNDFFRGELSLNNSTGSLWLTITNVAALRNGSNPDIVTNVIGSSFVPQTPETFGYDPDGNMTNDGRWSITWDGESRVTSFARRSGIAGPNTSVQCVSDYMGRRISKSVTSGASITYKYVYDGWNLIAILGLDGSLLYSFNWGADASGSIQGAGGVGGLISMTVHSGANAGTYFYSYDGNFNVVALVNAAIGEVAAQYEYGPFGELRRATGPVASVNPFLFSTKFYDTAIGLSHYEYRYFNPTLGAWLSPDPSQDSPVNLYAFANNDAVNTIDLFGLLPAYVTVSYQGHGSAEKNGASSQYVVIDDKIKGQVPLDVSDSRPAASITATLDDSFNADIRSWTRLSSDNGIKSLQLSTFLNGTITACCACPFKRVKATWTISAGVSGTAGLADASFDGNRVVGRVNKLPASQTGVTYKELNSSYCATFTFGLGQGWTDSSKIPPMVSHVNVRAVFDCVEELLP